jgi:hypothetical protein
MLILLNKLKKLWGERFICGNGAEIAGRRGERIFKYSDPLIATASRALISQLKYNGRLLIRS